MQTLNTYLAVANVGASMDFLEHAFGFEQGVILPDADGQIRYAEMRHGTSVVMLIRKGDTTAATSGVSAIYTSWTTWIARWNTHDKPAPESRRLTTSPGAIVWQRVTDPDGYRWMLATFKKLAPFV